MRWSAAATGWSGQQWSLETTRNGFYGPTCAKGEIHLSLRGSESKKRKQRHNSFSPPHSCHHLSLFFISVFPCESASPGKQETSAVEYVVSRLEWQQPLPSSGCSPWKIRKLNSRVALRASWSADLLVHTGELPGPNARNAGGAAVRIRSVKGRRARRCSSTRARDSSIPVSLGAIEEDESIKNSPFAATATFI